MKQEEEKKKTFLISRKKEKKIKKKRLQIKIHQGVVVAIVVVYKENSLAASIKHTLEDGNCTKKQRKKETHRRN